MKFNSLIPELYCSDFERSLKFYREVLGFSVLYTRPEERFAFLELEGSQLMIEQTVDPKRVWLAAEAEYPFGRGMSLQMKISDVNVLYEKCRSAGAKVFLPLEEKWYQGGNKLYGNWQFIVMDPDGYLLRFSQDLGQKNVS